MSLPSKLTSYFAAGRPVLAVVDPAGVTANEVRFSGAGVVVPQGDPPKFVAALRRLLDDPDFAAKLSAAGPVHCERHLSSAAGLTAISNLVGEVICESEQVRLSK
jgi:glycosyltransferase involved in cell wall biosynthesis